MLLEGILDGDEGKASEAAADLAWWVKRGGFSPEEITEAQAALCEREGIAHASE